MTDSDGHEHGFTVPAGKIRPGIWEKQRESAEKSLPPQFLELVTKTETPFIQAVTDVRSPTASLMDGKVILVGDAVAGFRPHTAGSTGQAAWHSLLLDELDFLGEGKTTMPEWEVKVMEWAEVRGKQGIDMGERSQFGKHPLSD